MSLVSSGRCLVTGGFHGVRLIDHALVLVAAAATAFTDSTAGTQLCTLQSRNRRIAASVDGENGVPTLTPLPAGDKKPRKQTIAAIIGGASAALLVVIILVLVYICLMRVKRLMRRTSETASSVPSPTVELPRFKTSQYVGAPSPYDTQNLRQLTMSELEHATNNFSQSNIIGEGRFGLVYKGLLQDGAIVAIKRCCLNTPVHIFLNEVNQIAQVNHKHLVKLVGYCEDSHQQFLVFDYIPNGNVGNHLYGSPTGKLNMRQRLLIALGAAKGLEYLHSLAPPVLHMHFRSSNVLLDENFAAKVSDFGLSKLVSDDHFQASSSAIDCFLDPDTFFSDIINVKSNNNLINFVDKTLADKSMRAAKDVVELALQCLDVSSRRPSMKSIVQELERIQEKEIGRLHIGLEEEIGAVTLGSELFR
ncbi:hypothetical protein CCACVL1_20502 [Corchorus capsularis]|uniref:non-specific serine/threonine protein kinase n=1 Tax=Corchorus capsularis TaxID=210143 RepID=A0A1R3HAW5_COCAP|nr:hypothetical protein CCACVL1_20502 [Corchorus capsularis]